MMDDVVVRQGWTRCPALGICRADIYVCVSSSVCVGARGRPLSRELEPPACRGTRRSNDSRTIETSNARVPGKTRRRRTRKLRRRPRECRPRTGSRPRRSNTRRGPNAAGRRARLRANRTRRCRTREAGRGHCRLCGPRRRGSSRATDGSRSLLVDERRPAHACRCKAGGGSCGILSLSTGGPRSGATA
ncbi:hypothetical protein GY45DRAFT_48471 [Cubamyces sp. BRFM 1775]|nr:hypothetical protein GY45DRAFT_48471 [Cubamyces sp. BRFM 1775]